MVDCGIPNRFAAALPPVDSANLTASALNSSVYRRFGTDSLFPISPSFHQKVTNNLMYVKPGQGHHDALTPENSTATPNGSSWPGWPNSSLPHSAVIDPQR